MYCHPKIEIVVTYYLNHMIITQKTIQCLIISICLKLHIVEGADPARREELIDLLDIDLEWRMHKVSDGQRRRVQICMGLLQSYKVQ